MTDRKWLINLATVAFFSLIGSSITTAFIQGGTAQAGGFASTIQSWTTDGQPAQAFYGEDGKMRIQLGTYSAAGERGLPLVGLSDNKGHLRMLLRLAGTNESPVLIMKDKSGNDRLVMGLSLSDTSEEPFLSVTGADGQRKAIFGSY
ncbi:MAG: hypothetical protein ACAH80_18015 [Alphaproteobacteria bacterium]